MLEHAGLWGDGDETDALKLIEKRFGLRLAPTVVEQCRTAGDLYDALIRARPEIGNGKVAWRRMVVALTWFTGLDPRQIARETLLIEPKHPAILTRLFRKIFHRINAHA